MQELFIIKIGGNVVDAPEVLHPFLASLTDIPQPKILVHGGGKLATRLSKKLGIESKMVDGRRITDAETLDVVTMVYAGLVNKTIVSSLQKNNVNAIGLSGADGNLIQAHKRTGSDIDYGFVGDIDVVNAHLLDTLLSAMMLPVVSPISHDRQGQLLNTNADTIASAIAMAMASYSFKVTLLYVFELPGVLEDINNPDSLIKSMTIQSYSDWKEKGVITAGMIPKLDNCFEAIKNGVDRVIIANPASISDLTKGKSVGTVLSI